VKPLIAGSRVAGTGVHDADGNKLGTVQDLIIGREDGRVSYAVLRLGGWMGVGGQDHPLPWAALRYDPGFDGYVLAVGEAQLREAPLLDSGAATDWNDPALRERVGHYFAGMK